MTQQLIGVRPGYATTTTCEVVVCSLNSGNAVITINNIPFAVTMSQIGTDAPVGHPFNGAQAGYVGSVQITGLSAFTRYNYTCDQAGNRVTGSFLTAPSDTDDFSFFIGTCDNNTSLGGQAAGFWPQIRAYMEADGSLPTAGILFIDDHGYWDFNSMNDSGGTGHYMTAGTTSAAVDGFKVYDYALGALGNFGLFEDSSDDYVAWGQDTDRVWCTRNLNYWPQWGDHDCGKGNIGWSVAKSGDDLTRFNNSGTVWTAFMDPLQPPAIDGVNSNAWGFTLGCVYIATMDAITNGTGNGDADTAPTTIYGNTQIDSVLSALNNTSEFKILGIANGIRYTTTTGTGNDRGAQFPLSLHATEYKRLFTDSGNPESSIMENSRTNGTAGTTVVATGDYHNAKVQKNTNTDGTLDELFYSIAMGTINGSTNFARPVVSGVSGVELELAEGNDNGSDFWGCRVDVYGSRHKKELHITMLGPGGEVLWSKKFVHQRGGNLAFAQGANPNDKSLTPSVV